LSACQHESQPAWWRQGGASQGHTGRLHSQCGHRPRCARECALTLPSRGRPTSGFASCRPPLMSNVRRPGRSRCSSSAVLNSPASFGPCLQAGGQRTVGAFEACGAGEAPEFEPGFGTAGKPNTNDWGRPCHIGAIARISESLSQWPGRSGALRETAIREAKSSRATRAALCHRPRIKHTAAMQRKASRISNFGRSRGTPNPG